MNQKTQIQTPTESYRLCYPEIVRLADQQLEDKLWFHSEMKVELDRLQLKFELTSEQKHAVLYVLRMFLQYELIVGEEFWIGRVMKAFPRPEIARAASIVAMVELAVHAPFYDKINVVLGLDKDEDYVAYKEDEELVERRRWLAEALSDEDDISAVLAFGLTETQLLFSSFSILKSFQSNGYNKIPVVVRGTNQSAIDEDHHGLIAAEIINTYYEELGVSLYEDKPRYNKLIDAICVATDHEDRVIDNAIPGDSLNGVLKSHYKQYIRHRANIYLNRLGCPNYFEIGECSIVDWFEKNTVAYKQIDFFTPGLGSEYSSAWDAQALVSAWKKGSN